MDCSKPLSVSATKRIRFFTWKVTEREAERERKTEKQRERERRREREKGREIEAERERQREGAERDVERDYFKSRADCNYHQRALIQQIFYQNEVRD